ncbi:Uncharacterised protein [Chryseobacterium gleum]|uniref:Response regulatory domain-containing protein n=2 Tax=Chryseobacterium gleum TaxID=250 RepID=A0A3S5E2X9_CHRGE|nr:hypothetical protein [Chryseobacterium gleum]EFK36265.1 hypothetical protein HMPREF0204_11712 [Chryseobacterium gleum ATCC 35910]QQY33516.1 hypothetical protein I6I60_07000 [Chryseobacterium gleum]VEE08585.1 Uncharacterised protein [Chryseobacterium gleum]
MDFTILMYEDDQQYKDSFEYNLAPKVETKGRNLVIRHRLNGDSIEQDLMMISPDLIMIDHDLGASTGDELIEILDSTPENIKVMLIYYSGGETLDDLQETVKKYKCHVQCFTKEGDELENAILSMIR